MNVIVTEVEYEENKIKELFADKVQTIDTT